MLPKQSQNLLTGPRDEVHGSQFEVRLRAGESAALVHVRLLAVQNTF